jgi:hypothetical protein
MIPPLAPSPSPREWPAEVHQQVLAHYDQGQYCSAYALVQPYGAFNQLQGNQTRILAGRLADRLGGIRLRLRFPHARPIATKRPAMGINWMGLQSAPYP